MIMDKSLLDIYKECDRELALAEEELHRTEQLLAELNKQKGGDKVLSYLWERISLMDRLADEWFPMDDEGEEA